MQWRVSKEAEVCDVAWDEAIPMFYGGKYGLYCPACAREALKKGRERLLEPFTSCEGQEVERYRENVNCCVCGRYIGERDVGKRIPNVGDAFIIHVKGEDVYEALVGDDWLGEFTTIAEAARHILSLSASGLNAGQPIWFVDRGGNYAEYGEPAAS